MTFRTNMSYLRGRIAEVYRYRNMISSLVKRDLKGRYRNSALGFLWNFMNPLFQIIIYFIVFSALMIFTMDAYYVFLPVGMMPWFFFSGSMNEGSKCIVSNSSMVSKMNFPREVIPIKTVLSNFVNFLISYSIVFVLIAVTGYGFNGIALLLLPVIIIIQFFFILGIVFMTSATNVYYRDVSSVIGVLMMGMIWITPIMYRSYFDDALLQTIIAYNPLTYFMNVYHDILYFKTVPDLFDLGVCTLLAVTVMIIGWLIFVKLQHRFAEEL